LQHRVSFISATTCNEEIEMIEIKHWVDDSESPTLQRFDAISGDRNVGYLTSHPATDGGIWLKGLKVAADCRRQGIARRLLEYALAYYNGQELSLRAKPYAGGVATCDDLQKFYGEYGFVPYDDEGRMTRPASPSREATRNRVEVLLHLGDGFLVERLADPRWPDSIGKTRCPGGKIEEGESPLTALVRELGEEYDLDVVPAMFAFVSRVDGPRGYLTRYAAAAPPTWVGLPCVEGGGEVLVQTRAQPAPWF